MKTYQFVVFFAIVLAVYGGLNFYLYSWAMMAIPDGSAVRNLFPWIFWLLVLSYPLARLLERVWLSPVSDFFTWTGSFWLGGMFYLLVAVLCFDLIRIVHLGVPVYPAFLVKDPVATRFWLFKGVAAITAVVILAGHINALTPRINRLNLNVGKKAGDFRELSLVMVSDIHMGTLIGPNRTRKMVEKINALKPDLILFAGDLVDEDLAPVIRHDLGKSLKQLSAPLGVYAITGNHEYIGGAEKAVMYLENHGIKVLRDTAVLIGNSFYLAGREDRDRLRFSGKPRKTIPEILRGVDTSKPVILMDHQPFHLQEAADNNVDLQLSGHTHHGQLWPLNYLTRAIYEISHGYRQINGTHFYVSCGYGGWGPPMRIGNRPEINSIRLSFKK